MRALLLSLTALSIFLIFQTASASVVVIAAAGDISPAGGGQGDDATAALINQLPSDTQVLALGDNQYEDGCLSDFNTYYNASWGTFKSRTHPIVGNHDAHDTGCSVDANGYFDYFNGSGQSSGPAGTRGEGWYAFDVGSWRLYALNSECNGTSYDFCDHNAQKAWLSNDLANNPRTCTLAFFHRGIAMPSSSHSNDEGHFKDGTDPNVLQTLYDAGVDVVLAGHDHLYARYARYNRAGTDVDPAGIRHFVVGSGGIGNYAVAETLPGQEASNCTTFGIIRMSLGSNYYTWNYISTTGTYSDSGSERCRAVPYQQPADVTPPDANDDDSDGYTDTVEANLGTDPADPCSWPTDVQTNGVFNIGDINSFTTPNRTGDNIDSHGNFNMFSHTLDDDGDTVIESNEDPDSNGGTNDPPTFNVARYNLQQATGHTPTTKIDIGDINIMSNSPIGGPAYPGMFAQQKAWTRSCNDYYVDQTGGNDANNGQSPATAWKTISKVNGASLTNSQIYFKRGEVWSGTELKPTSTSGNVYAAYGTGALPKITGTTTSDCMELLNATNVAVTNIHFDNCGWAGIQVTGASTSGSIVILNNLLTRSVAGVHITDTVTGSAQPLIKGNSIIDNNKMSVNTPGGSDDSGAWGVLLNNSGGAEVANNYITGSDTFSYDFVRDGAAVELFNASNAYIHHNISLENDTFVETGGNGPIDNNNWIEFNRVYNNLPLGKGIVHNGSLVTGLHVAHNTIWLTGSTSEGVVCFSTCSTAILEIKENIIKGISKSVHASGQPSTAWNDYVGSRTGSWSMDSTDQADVDPGFVNQPAGDYHLSASSPLIGDGDCTVGDVPYTYAEVDYDIDNQLVPQGSCRDVGADER